MSAEAEPRRSVRSTKGQNTKNLDLDQPATETKRRGRKKKQEEQIEEQPEEEIIRCVCGATEQTGDSGEPWIACDKCAAWQHNVCVGKSIYDEDLASEYFCEICKPEDHKELLEGMARGEKPWEERRRAYEEESKKKKKVGPGKRGAKGKRASDVPAKDTPKEQTPAPAKGKPSPAPSATAKAATPTPAPEPKKDAPKTTPTPGAGTKRKAKEPAEDKGAQKLRKVSESQAVAGGASPESPVEEAASESPAPAPEPPREIVPYDPPADLASAVSELPQTRQNPAKMLQKNMTAAMASLEKKGYKFPDDDITPAQRAEQFALQVERAVQDTHASAKEYGGQIKTLGFNIKSNLDLVKRLVERTLSPPMLATMTTDELASKELQRETAKMRERAEKQSILITEEGPRVKITHKGEEVIEKDDGPSQTDDVAPVMSRPHKAPEHGPAPDEHRNEADGDAMEVELPADLEYKRPPLRIDPQHPTKASGFDIKKVFSKVKSPTQPVRRLSHQSSRSPVDDAEVDRLIADDDGPESPPYSPTEDTEQDPDVIWRGALEMPGVATLTVSSKFMGGGNLKASINLPWEKLFPGRISVAGRLGKDDACSYLCGMRWRSMFDLVVASLTPTSEAAKPQFQKIVDYFVTRKKYGVVGDKALPAVRDMYLIPLLPDGEVPEIMMNLEDNLVPEKRTEPMMLVVFVYQNDAEQLKRLREQKQPQVQQTPTPLQARQPPFSPNTPQGAFPGNGLPPNGRGQAAPAHGMPAVAPSVPATNGAPQTAAPVAGGPVDHGAAMERARVEGVAAARQILGEELFKSPSLQYLLPGAGRMHPREWLTVKSILQDNPRAREDLQSLTELVTEYSKQQTQQAQQRQQRQAPAAARPGPPAVQPSPVQRAPQAGRQKAQAQVPADAPTYASPVQPALQQQQQQQQHKAAAMPVPVNTSPKSQQAIPAQPPAQRPAPISQTPVPVPRIPQTPQPKVASAPGASPGKPTQAVPAQVTPVPAPSPAAPAAPSAQ